MKRAFLLLVTALMWVNFSLLAQQANPNAPKRQGWCEEISLCGDVESVVCTTYSVREQYGKIVRCEVRDKQTYQFNDAGDVTEHRNHRRSSITSYEYNSAGNLMKVSNFGSEGWLDSRKIYKYNSAGNLFEIVEYDSDGNLNRSYKYDTAGNLIEASCDGVKYTWKYNSKGNRIRAVVTMGDFSLEYIYKYQYDSAGRIVKMTFCPPSAGLCLQFTDSWKYDSIGNLVEHFDSSHGTCGIDQYACYGNEFDDYIPVEAGENQDAYGRTRYDSAGNVIEILVCFDCFFEGSFEASSEFEIQTNYLYKKDSAGNVLEVKEYNYGSFTSKKVRKYDSRGNMIEETTYETEALIPVEQKVYQIVYRR